MSDKMQFYKPKQGDTASVVADGYGRNFEALDAAKADAEATAAALAGKADKAAGKDLMTDAERQKLAGIEAQANRYVHPGVHPADMIADTPAKVVMTAQERDKLARVESGANAYTLPAASADTLGGVKAGRNLTVDPDGTLHAPSPAGVEPDAVLALGQVAASDRLLAFNASGEPVTATAGKLREYAAEGLATADAVNAALETKVDNNARYYYLDSESFKNTGGGIDDDAATNGFAAAYTLSAGDGVAMQLFGRLGLDQFWIRCTDDNKQWKPKRQLWHSGNFDPASKVDCRKLAPTEDCDDLYENGIYWIDDDATARGIANRPFDLSFGILTIRNASCTQIAVCYGTYEIRMRRKHWGGSWNEWKSLQETLTPATAASVGLMSAEDKIKLNSVASAMSLSVGEAAAALSLDDGEAPQEPKVDPGIQIRAQRSAQYQMQSDELLYEALETFARNHPEYTEFAAWLQTKDRIRQELPAPENGPAR